MGLIVIDIYPSAGFAGIVIAITILVAIWRFLGFIAKKSKTDDFSSSNEQNNSDNESNAKPSPSRFDNYLFYLLQITFIIFSILGLIDVDNNYYKIDPWLLTSKKFPHLSPLFAIQGLAICTAYLIWVYNQKRTQRVTLIFFGFFLQCLSVMVGCVSHFLDYPPLHWVQTIEILLAGFFMMLIPLWGILVFYRKR